MNPPRLRSGDFIDVQFVIIGALMIRRMWTEMQFDKNGIRLEHGDVYCYPCSGNDYYTMTKGRMKFVRDRGTMSFPLEYKCVDCNYVCGYNPDYEGKYGIK